MHHDEESEEVIFEPLDESGEEVTHKAKAKHARSEMEELRKERDEYLTSLQRARADYINLQKEEEKKRFEMSSFTKKNLVEDLLPTLDAFESAMKNKQVWESVDANWRVGIEYIASNLHKTLEDWGVKRLEAANTLNQPFDPNIHEPTEYRENAEAPPDTVIEVIQSGYEIGNYVIRPVKVVVSKGE